MINVIYVGNPHKYDNMSSSELQGNYFLWLEIDVECPCIYNQDFNSFEKCNSMIRKLSWKVA